MDYPWVSSFNAVTSTGVARVVEMIKLGIKEIPRLHNELLSQNNERYIKARREILAIFFRLDEEILKARVELGMSDTEFNTALRQSENFTPEERDALKSLPHLLKLYGIDLFNLQPTPKKPKKRKRPPRFKV